MDFRRHVDNLLLRFLLVLPHRILKTFKGTDSTASLGNIFSYKCFQFSSVEEQSMLFPTARCPDEEHSSQADSSPAASAQR